MDDIEQQTLEMIPDELEKVRFALKYIKLDIQCVELIYNTLSSIVSLIETENEIDIVDEQMRADEEKMV